MIEQMDGTTSALARDDNVILADLSHPPAFHLIAQPDGGAAIPG
jgi:hypothetical protein